LSAIIEVLERFSRRCSPKKGRNNMSSRLGKFRIGVIAGVFLVAFGFSSAIASFGNSAPVVGDKPAGSGSFSSTVAVPPWCGWSQTPATESLTLTGEGSYTGESYNLEGTSGDIYAYVNGGSAITSEAAADNCSWFGTSPYGAQLDMSVPDTNFEGESDDAAAEGVDAAFSWSGNLGFANNFKVGSCANFTTTPGAELSTGGLVTVWTVAAADATTNNFCDYSITYTSTIPAGLNPTYGDSNYTITGPTLTVTLTTTAAGS